MDDTWLVRETAFTRTSLRPQQAVFTIGNGHLSTRGAFEEGFLGEQPATLVHGVFDDVPIAMTELANVPNWLPLVPYLDEQPVQLDAGEADGYERVLNLHTGLLIRSYRWRSPAGHTVEVAYERFVSRADANVMAVRCRLTSVDWSGTLTLEAALQGDVATNGVPHWHKVAQGAVDEQTIYLQSATRHTGIALSEAARLYVDGGDVTYSVRERENAPTVLARVDVAPGQTITAEKIVTLFSSHDVGRRTLEAALELLAGVTGAGPAFDWLQAASARVWAADWEVSDVQIDGDAEAQIATRYNIFQLLIAAPRDNAYVSIPAKTLSGFGYRGHVFWDTEIFILPFFTFTQPEIARNLLLYRYHTLGGAREKAHEGGYKGAQFPWESALTGDEVTPRFVPGPDGQSVRIWTGDIELHISSDIAYATWMYWQITGDDAFMGQYGAELILDTALFWGSRVEWHPGASHYQITDVIGPDEYHEHVDNNFFTNYLVKWHLETALDVLRWLQEHDAAKATALTERLGLNDDEVERWRDIAGRMYLGRGPEADSKVFEQFAGYFQRRDVDLAALEPRDRSVQALLGIQPTNETQVLKQPDVLMLFYLLPEAFDDASVRANWDYYTPRTDLSHGSSLAPGIQAILACRLGEPDYALRFFMNAALVDIHDLRRNTEHGIHGATAGSVWQAAVFGFGGLHLTASGLHVTPHLPATWRRLRFSVVYRGERRDFSFDGPGLPRESERAAS